MIYHPKNNYIFTFNIYDFILCFQVGIMSSDSDDDIAPSAHTIKLLRDAFQKKNSKIWDIGPNFLDPLPP